MDTQHFYLNSFKYSTIHLAELIYLLVFENILRRLKVIKEIAKIDNLNNILRFIGSLNTFIYLQPNR